MRLRRASSLTGCVSEKILFNYSVFDGCRLPRLLMAVFARRLEDAFAAGPKDVRGEGTTFCINRLVTPN